MYLSSDRRQEDYLLFIEIKKKCLCLENNDIHSPPTVWMAIYHASTIISMLYWSDSAFNSFTNVQQFLTAIQTINDRWQYLIKLIAIRHHLNLWSISRMHKHIWKWCSNFSTLGLSIDIVSSIDIVAVVIVITRNV